MDTFMKADIFFFVTTIAVIAFLIMGSIAFYYLIGILRNVKHASDKFKGAIDAANEHAHELYHEIRESFLFNLIFRKKSRGASKKN